MPVYDFVCLACDQRFDLFLTYAEYGRKRPACPHCKSRNIRRRLTRVRLGKSDEARLASMAGDLSDPSALAAMENDPRTMGRVMRKMGKEMGEQLPGEFNDVVDRLEKGQTPDEIEKEMPDLGAGDLSDS